VRLETNQTARSSVVTMLALAAAFMSVIAAAVGAAVVLFGWRMAK